MDTHRRCPECGITYVNTIVLLVSVFKTINGQLVGACNACRDDTSSAQVLLQKAWDEGRAERNRRLKVQEEYQVNVVVQDIRKHSENALRELKREMWMLEAQLDRKIDREINRNIRTAQRAKSGAYRMEFRAHSQRAENPPVGQA